MDYDNSVDMLPLNNVVVNVFGETTAVLMCAEWLKIHGAEIRYLKSEDVFSEYVSGDVYISDSHFVHDTQKINGKNGIYCEIISSSSDSIYDGIDYLPDEILQARYGLASVSSFRDGEPTVFNDGIITGQSALYAASCIAAALWKRTSTSEDSPISIRVTHEDVALNSLITFIPVAIRGEIIPVLGNHHPGLSPWNCYDAIDGSLFICAPTDAQWRSLCQVIGREDCITDPRFDKLSCRLRFRNDIDGIIAPWVAKHTVEACLKLLNNSGVPTGPVLNRSDVEVEANLSFRSSRRSPVLRQDGYLFDAPYICVPFNIQKENDLSERTNAWPDVVAIDGLLAGMRVLELGTNTAAPLPAKQMAALGAHVLKVEGINGDPIRKSSPVTADGVSHLFYLSNTNKQSIQLDLNTASGKVILKELIRSADILIENMKPGALSKLGFTIDDFARINPKLVYTSVSGFGHTSIYPGRPAYDAIIQAMSGCMVQKPGASTPLKVGVSISDLVGGQTALLASILGAIWVNKLKTGIHLDISMQDAVVGNAHLYRRLKIPHNDFVISAIKTGHLVHDLPGTAVPTKIADLLCSLAEKDATILLKEYGAHYIQRVQGISELILDPLNIHDSTDKSVTEIYPLKAPMSIYPYKIRTAQKIECINSHEINIYPVTNNSI